MKKKQLVTILESTREQLISLCNDNKKILGLQNKVQSSGSIDCSQNDDQTMIKSVELQGQSLATLESAFEILTKMRFVKDSKLQPEYNRIYNELINSDAIKTIKVENPIIMPESGTKKGSHQPSLFVKPNPLVLAMQNIVTLLKFLHNLALAYQIKNYDNRSVINTIEKTITTLPPSSQHSNNDSSSSFNATPAAETCVFCNIV